MYRKSSGVDLGLSDARLLHNQGSSGCHGLRRGKCHKHKLVISNKHSSHRAFVMRKFFSSVCAKAPAFPAQVFGFQKRRGQTEREKQPRKCYPGNALNKKKDTSAIWGIAKFDLKLGFMAGRPSTVPGMLQNQRNIVIVHHVV